MPTPPDASLADAGVIADAGIGSDGGGSDTPVIERIEPTSGLVSGGEPVAIIGQNFMSGATVQIGGFFAGDVVVASATRITATTPPAPAAGLADVFVSNPNGRAAILRQAFTYNDLPPRPIDWCAFFSPAQRSVLPNEPFEMRGRIFSEMLTPGAGRGMGLRAQGGYGFPGTDPAGWTWLTAVYDGDVDGLVTGDLANDEYRLTLQVPLEGTYRLAFRFSGDDGRSWTYCDLDGLDNGFTEAQTGELNVQTATVGFCKLDRPNMATAEPGQASEAFFGHVFVAGATAGAGQGAGVRAQLGYGPVGASPINETWTWTNATYAADVDGLTVGDQANDEYQASLTVAEAGQFDVAFRFSVDDGASWLYCDLDGSENGYESAKAGAIRVEPASTGVDWCRFEGPASVQIVLGETSPALVGRVHEGGVTPGDGQGTGIRGQVGYGPTTAAVNSPAWTWSDANYSADVDGLSVGDKANDEYSATLSPPLPGTYAVAYRFSLDSGQSWSYCDLDGLDNGFDLASQTGRIEVTGLSVGYCEINRPTTAQVVSGEVVTYHGRVFVSGRTPGDGQGSGILAQVGYGAEAADPATWSWSAATYATDVDGLSAGDKANDEYTATLTVVTPGSYRVAYRFSIDGGQTWTLCDAPPDGSGNGFSAADAAALTVVPVAVDFCSIDRPASTTLVTGETIPPFFGRVFVAGRSPGTGQGAGVRAQVGYGDVAALPSTWTWTEASYAADVDGLMQGDLANDEYSASFALTAAGEYRVAYRFSVDDGVSWTLCDLPPNGSGDGFEATGAATLTIQPLSVGHCQSKAPETIDIGQGLVSDDLKGEVFVAGRTPGDGQGGDIRGQVGYGPAADAPGESSWKWFDASYRGDVDGLSAGDKANDEYGLALAFADAGIFALAFRFSVDAGQTWTYCDRDGSANGFDAASATTLTVATRQVSDGRIQPPTPVHAVAGLPVEPLFGQVNVPGFTSGAGQAEKVVAEVGFGPVGSDPSTDGTWTWLSTSFNPFGPTGDYDEYFAAITIPAPAADKDLAFRFILEGGTEWTYADLDGSANGYSAAQAKRAVVVAPVGGGIDYCATEQPQTLTLAIGPSGATSNTVTGRVFKTGVTPGSGWGAGIAAQLGYGEKSADPSTWTWSPAGYRRDVDGLSSGDQANDEYEAFFHLPFGATGVDLGFAFRFTADGSTWTYCGLAPAGTTAAFTPGTLTLE